MEQGTGLLDLLIALLQSMVVLLLASGVYVALVVRKTDDSAPPATPESHPRGPRSLTSPHADSPST